MESESSVLDWEIPIPRVMGGPGGGVGIGLSHGMLVELSSEARVVRVVALGWAAVGWEPAAARLALHHPLHSLLSTAEEAELVLWTGMRVRWEASGKVGVSPPPSLASSGPAWRLGSEQLYWSPDASPSTPLVHSNHDVTLDVFAPSEAEEESEEAGGISPAGQKMGEEAVVIPNAKEENLTMIIGGWKIRQELKQGEVRVEGASGEGGLRLNPTTREISLNSPALRLYVSGQGNGRMYLRGTTPAQPHLSRSVRSEGPRLSINQTPSFFDHYANLYL